MKKFLSIFILFFFSYSQSFANVGAAHINVNGIIKPSKNALISRYIEVEKELLTFELKQGNIIQKGKTFVGKEYFLKKYKNNAKIVSYIKNNTLGINTSGNGKYDTLDKHEKTPVKFYELTHPSAERPVDRYFEVTAKYFLKNTSDKNLKNQKVFFSDFKPKFLNGFHYAEGVYDQSFLDYLVLLYEKNNFAQDVEVTFDNKKIDTSTSLIFEKANPSILNTKLPPKNIIYGKEVSAFELNFFPNQNHILEVKYKIPAFTFYDKEATVFYDFSPIFSWKGAKVKDVEIQLLGMKGYDLDQENSSFAKDFVEENEVFILRKQNIDSKSGFDFLQFRLMPEENKK